MEGKSLLLTTCILSVLLNRLTACINLRVKLLWLTLWCCLLWLAIPTSYQMCCVNLTLNELPLLLTIWSFHLPAVQLIEPSSVSRLMSLQSDVGGDDFTYLDAELLNLV